jgi:hypothetical protein
VVTTTPTVAKERRRDSDLAEPAPGGRQPALEEDRCQCDHAHLARELGIVELDPAETVGAEQHPEPQERDQGGDARTGRTERDHDARR